MARSEAGLVGVQQGSTVYGYPTATGESSPPPSECKQGSTVYGYPTAPAESSPPPLEWRANYATPFRAGQTQPLAGPGFETPTLGV